MSAGDTRRWAHAYAGLGWRVFPVVAGGKKPMYTGWQSDATTYPALIDRWWRGDPTPNIGIVTGEAFVAFDIEAAHLDAFRAWVRRQPAPLPPTPIARTGRGGIHILARAPSIAGRDLILDGVHIGELKARGGFIVACPSVTAIPYGWHRSPVEVALADAPGWLLGLIRVPGPVISASCGRTIGIAEGERRLAALARTVAGAPEGRRNAILYWAMRRALDAGIPTSVTASVLTRMGATAGLTDREIRATVASALEGASR